MACLFTIHPCGNIDLGNINLFRSMRFQIFLVITVFAVGFLIGISPHIPVMAHAFIDSSINGIDEAESWQYKDYYRKYHKKWKSHPYVGATKKKLVRVLGEPYQQVTNESEFSMMMPEADEIGLYRDAKHYTLFFKNSCCIGVIMGPHQVVSFEANDFLTSTRTSLVNLKKQLGGPVESGHNIYSYK